MAIMPTVLVTQHRGGATPGSYRLTGGTTVGAVITGTYGQNEADAIDRMGYCGANDTVEFLGDIYSVNTDDNANILIRKRPGGGGAWSPAHAIGQPSALFDSTQRTGLMVISTGSVTYLCLVFTSTSQSLTKLARTSDGTSWTNFTLGGSFGLVLSNLGVRVYRGLVLIPAAATSAANALVIIDVVSASLAAVTISPRVGVSGGCVCVFKNRVFYLDPPASGGQAAALFEYTAGALTQRAVLGTSMGNLGNLSQQLLFAVGDSHMVAVFLDADDGSNTNICWRATNIAVSGATCTPTVKNSLIPAGLQRLGATSNKHTFGFWAFQDNETAPATPKTFIFLANDETGAAESGEYIDSDTELLTATTGVTPENFSFVVGHGGGEYINTSDMDFFIDDVQVAQGTLPGRVLIRFRAYGGGSADKFVRGYFNSLENTGGTQMTLIGSVTGGSAIRNVNQLEQVTANGAQYTFEWNATGNGQTNGQPENIWLVLATT